MKTLYFASANRGKTQEMQSLLAGLVDLKDLNSLGTTVHWEETGETFRENAEIKARVVRALVEAPVFSDDSGLCVEALNGAPGVYSARWAGAEGDDLANNRKLLDALSSVPTERRQAYFYCVVIYKDEMNREFCFDGRLDGKILNAPQGTGGFGYDSLFQPAGFDKTLAQMTAAEKNRISHRAQAIGKLKAFLRKG